VGVSAVASAGWLVADSSAPARSARVRKVRLGVRNVIKRV